MTRKDFFKKLGITLGAVAIAPQLLAKEEKKVRNVGKEQNEWYWNHRYPFTLEECYEDGVIWDNKAYYIRDDIWPSRLWNKDKTDYIDLSG